MPPITQQEEKQTRDERYDPQRIETKWFEQWQHDPALYAGGQFHQAKILRARNVALSFGGLAHGTCAQLFNRGRSRALHVDERVQRPPSHGMGLFWPARRKRSNQEQ